MSESVFVGIDYGELDIRVAYARDGAPLLLEQDAARREPTILFDAARNVSSLGVSFPSVLQNVGTQMTFQNAGRSEMPETLVQRWLTAIAERIRTNAGGAPGPTVIAVPAELSQRKRQTLIECAKRSGFETVSLLDRAIAVTLGVRTDRDQSGTFLVFHLDHGACEYSLARLARGRCWILGSAFEPRFSGERLDALIMEDIILALREKQVFLGLKSFDATLWHTFRALAETLRRHLAVQPDSEIAMNRELTDTTNPILVRLDAGRFAHAVREELGETLENMHALVEQHQLESANIDALILTGYAASSHPVANILWDAYPGKIRRAHEYVVALGALTSAAEAAGATLAASNIGGMITPSDVTGLPATSASSERHGGGRFSDAVVVEGVVSRRPAPEPPRQSPSGDRLLFARSLIGDGRIAEAEQLLAGLTTEIEGLRELLKARVLTRPQQLIHQAQALVIDGLYAEAVSLAHQAYGAAKNDALVFSGMMKIHADAGLGLSRPEQYDDAIHILHCAYGHDQTDRTIHKALAERHYMHARAMQRLNNPARALEAARQALTFEPRHVEANELLSELMAPQREADSAT